jgi:hypothetical protein
MSPGRLGKLQVGQALGHNAGKEPHSHILDLADLQIQPVVTSRTYRQHEGGYPTCRNAKA